MFMIDVDKTYSNICRQTSHVEKITVLVDSINRLREASVTAATLVGRHDDDDDAVKVIKESAKANDTKVNKRQKTAGVGASKGGTRQREVGATTGATTGATMEALPLLRWVKAEDMAEAGLPTLTARIFKQACGPLGTLAA